MPSLHAFLHASIANPDGSSTLIDDHRRGHRRASHVVTYCSIGRFRQNNSFAFVQPSEDSLSATACYMTAFLQCKGPVLNKSLPTFFPPYRQMDANAGNSLIGDLTSSPPRITTFSLQNLSTNANPLQTSPSALSDISTRQPVAQRPSILFAVNSTPSSKQQTIKSPDSPGQTA